MIGRTTKSALVRNSFGALCINLEMRRSGIYYDNIIWGIKYERMIRAYNKITTPYNLRENREYNF